MKFDCINAETGRLYKDLVIIQEEDLFSTIILHIGNYIFDPGMTNNVLTSRLKTLYEYHNFKIIYRE